MTKKRVKRKGENMQGMVLKVKGERDRERTPR